MRFGILRGSLTADQASFEEFNKETLFNSKWSSPLSRMTSGDGLALCISQFSDVRALKNFIRDNAHHYFFENIGILHSELEKLKDKDSSNKENQQRLYDLLTPLLSPYKGNLAECMPQYISRMWQASFESFNKVPSWKDATSKYGTWKKCMTKAANYLKSKLQPY